LDDQERDSYQQLLAALRRQYPSTNPLVHMQLERIARLKVQLDRIQNVMDSTFAETRLYGADEKNGSSSRKKQEDSTEMLEWKIARLIFPKLEDLGGWLETYEEKLRCVIAEVSSLGDPFHLDTHEEFLRRLPAFCVYVEDHARTNSQSTADAVAEICRSPFSIPRAVMAPVLRGFRAALEGPEQDSLGYEQQPYGGPPQAISDVSVAELQTCATRLREQTMPFLRQLERMRDADARAKLTQDAALPDPEKLDRLMRYQTTINRQLSSAVGELLELVRIG
jgi:hypothetical protein